MLRFGVALSAGLVIGAAIVTLAAPPARSSELGARIRSVSRTHAPVHLVVGPKYNSARYFVREQLASINFPSDAVGVTDDVSGGISIDDKGQIGSDSKFVVDITKLKSDRSMRDGYIQHRTLQTDQYPTVTLVPKQFQGLPSPIPDSGKVTFTLLGDLTVHGVTRPTNWAVTAYLRNGEVRGTASTGVTFDDFKLDKPKVGSVLSVADSIHLVYDFDLVPASGS
ncbi:MAG TPA: YceI family protein [Steroidobacteraceae bacterium]|nr:YceI family protein [Gemmatimonadaceae bacterium]